MTDPSGNIDFFISYRGPQAAWARWINWVVRTAGYSTTLMAEFQVGTTWTGNMRQAADDCRRLIPLYSDDYWTSGACVEEFDAYWRQHLQNGNARFLLPLVIQKCTVPDMHAMLLTARLHDLNRDDTREAILNVLNGIASIAVASAVYNEPEPPFPGVAISAGAVGGSPSASFTPFPAKLVTVDRKGFLNCGPAFETFENMLTLSPSTRILLVRGDGKQGKSTLLSTLYNHTRTLLGARSTGRVEFKKAGSSPEEHLASIARALGASVSGSGNNVQRVDGLLDACAGRPVVIFFDAFEHAEQQHRHWVGRVLERCLDDEQLRCVVAGRELPPAKSQPWGYLAVPIECDALGDKDAFIAHAERRKGLIATLPSSTTRQDFYKTRSRWLTTNSCASALAAVIVLLAVLWQFHDTPPGFKPASTVIAGSDDSPIDVGNINPPIPPDHQRSYLLEMEFPQVNWDSTRLEVGDVFFGLRAARSIMTSPLTSKEKWLNDASIPDRSNKRLVYRYAASIQGLHAQRTIDVKYYPKKVRCQYQPQASVIVLVSEPFTDRVGPGADAYRHATLTTPCKDAEFEVFPQSDIGIEGRARFAIAAIVFPADPTVLPSEPLKLELIP